MIEQQVGSHPRWGSPGCTEVNIVLESVLQAHLPDPCMVSSELVRVSGQVRQLVVVGQFFLRGASYDIIELLRGEWPSRHWADVATTYMPPVNELRVRSVVKTRSYSAEIQRL
jgi:hypothetical protein